jgi:hypothetical protein
MAPRHTNKRHPAERHSASHTKYNVGIKTLSMLALGITMLIVPYKIINFEAPCNLQIVILRKTFCYDKYHYIECCNAECCHSGYLCAKCIYAECQNGI